MCVAHIPNPKTNAQSKVSHIYTGPMDSPLAQDMIDLNPDVRLLILLTIKELFNFYSISKTNNFIFF